MDMEQLYGYVERYGNGSDMYIDYIRVYAEKPLDYKVPEEAIRKYHERVK